MTDGDPWVAGYNAAFWTSRLAVREPCPYPAGATETLEWAAGWAAGERYLDVQDDKDRMRMKHGSYQ